MSDSKQKWILSISSGVVLLAIIFLVSSLSGVQFHTGRLFFSPGDDPTGSKLLSELVGPDINGLFRLAFILLAALLPITIIVVIFSKEMRKQLRRYLKIMLAILAWVLVLQNLRPVLQNQQEPLIPEGLPGLDGGVDITSIALNSPPEWLVYLVSLLVVITFAFLGWFLYNRFNRPTMLEQIAQGAQSALSDLQAGADLKNTIMRCYQEMSRVIQKTWGLQRDEAMTVREFELGLREAGISNRDIQHLTRLFEKVRYSPHKPTEQEERQAVRSLTTVVHAAKRKKMVK